MRDNFCGKLKTILCKTGCKSRDQWILSFKHFFLPRQQSPLLSWHNSKILNNSQTFKNLNFPAILHFLGFILQMLFQRLSSARKLFHGDVEL